MAPLMFYGRPLAELQEDLWQVGVVMGIRYCVMCLADDDKTPAVCLINVGDGTTEAGYCKPCAEVMKKNGYTPRPLPPENRAKWKGKLTEAQRAEIIASPVSAAVLGRRYSVSDATIRNVRNKAAENAPKVEDAVDVIPDVPEIADRPALSIEEEVTHAEAREHFPKSVVDAIEEAQCVPCDTGRTCIYVEFDVTHGRADAFWNDLSIEEKAAIVRAKLVERWAQL